MSRLFKIVVASMLAIFALALPAAAKSGDGQAKIKFTETKHDFGIVNENAGSVSHEFEFINTGNANLLIYDVTTQCGCTRPEFPKNPIAPGKKGKIKVTYLPKGRPGSFNRKVTVYTNGKPAKTSVNVAGSVVPEKKKKK